MDQYDFSDPNYDFSGRSAILARRLRDASAQANAELGPERGQMVGGLYVAPNVGQYINQAAQKVLGARDLARVEAEQEALNKEQLRRYEDISKQLATPGTKTVLKRTLGEDLSAGPSMQETSEQVPLDYSNPEDLAADNARRMGLAMQMSKLQLPMAQKVAQDYLTKGATFPDTLATLQMRQIEAGQQAAQRALDKERADQLYRLTAAQQADLRREQIAATREVGQARIDAAKAKTDEAKAKVEEGRARADQLLNQLETNVDILDKNAGITNPERGSAENVISWAQNTGLGQTVGKMLGTTNQTARNNIENLAMNLVLELKNVKGLGASQMNSNMELQKYLTAVAGGQNYDAVSLRNAVRNARSLLGASSSSSGGGEETKTYQGVTYRKKPGTSGKNKSDWEPVNG